MSISVYISLFLCTLFAVTSNANSNDKTAKRLYDNAPLHNYWNEPSAQGRVYRVNGDRRTVLNPIDYSRTRYPDYQWRRYNYDYNGNHWNDAYNGWSRDGRFYSRKYDYNSWNYKNLWNRNFNYNRWNYNLDNWKPDPNKYHNWNVKFGEGNSYSRNFANTGFRCPDLAFGGYYADVNSGCQVYHICQEDGRQNSFFCGNGTLFNQKLLTCDFWYNVDCGSSESFYYLNERVGAFPRQPVTLNRYK